MLFYEEHFYGFSEGNLWKRRKKTIHFTTYISICKGNRHSKVLWSIVLYILYRFVLSLKNSHYAYIPPYMHKILPTLGNEKEQHKLNFTKNSQTSWFSRLTFSKCSFSLARLGKKSKVTPLKMHTDGVMHTQKFMQYWFLCVKIIWICQSPTQTIVLQGNKNNHYHSVFNF